MRKTDITADPTLDTPESGWYPPEEKDAPVTQMLIVKGKPIAHIIFQFPGWRSFSLVEMNASGTTGKPLSEDGSVPTREQAKAQCEEYARRMANAVRSA